VNGLGSGFIRCERSKLKASHIFGFVKLFSYNSSGVIVLDESTMLFSRGKLWRANLTSARGMKQNLRVIRGVNR
jgi:hypothetical protein